MAGLWKEFKTFAVKGNVVDMAVRVMIGAAFGAIVQSAVADLLMPPIGLLTGGVDLGEQFVVLAAGEVAGGPYVTLEQAREAGAVVIAYGAFLNAVLRFFIIAAVLFVVVRWTNRLRSPDTPPAPSTRPCLFCTTPIHRQATRCPQCTSMVEPHPEPASGP